ncbi:hypothetical protein E1301_Tti020364 [Triplophysa tibetana]|uniref:EGF-like domain-containing protein n=1 Tax=Triplophysa tibetana TaxID=1572043 RepID=A0A5A9P3W7_9TELE|nr:hypothetical protein E1301_Tti020364 [Triplophysa tibetana]
MVNESNVNECERHPCKNGGICTDLVANYSCECPGEYMGRNCQYIWYISIFSRNEKIRLQSWGEAVGSLSAVCVTDVHAIEPHHAQEEVVVISHACYDNEHQRLLGVVWVLRLSRHDVTEFQKLTQVVQSFISSWPKISTRYQRKSSQTVATYFWQRGLSQPNLTTSLH